jgi:hypothetical protein
MEVKKPAEIKIKYIWQKFQTDFHLQSALSFVMNLVFLRVDKNRSVTAQLSCAAGPLVSFTHCHLPGNGELHGQRQLLLGQ